MQCFKRLGAASAFMLAAITSVFAADSALHVRAGLPHVAAKSATTGELKVAYFGGSITAAEGWRGLTTAHLRTLFPKLTITEITAGLPGTGSDLGVCRLEQDVLQYHPDLIFVEFAVNDTNTAPEQIERTMEGIVRQARRANPQVDLCFVYTISTPGLPDLEAGRFPPSARAMERVAAHYGIPSLHFGVEIARRVGAHEINFKAPDQPDDARTFSLDGVHPTRAGHKIYFSTLERALPQLLAVAAPSASAELPAPLHTDNWEGARLTLLTPAMRHGDWSPVAKDDANLRGATKHLLPALWRTEDVHTAVEFEFTGSKFGLYGIAAPDSGEFRVTIDDLPPVEGTFFDAYVSPTFCRQREWFYPAQLNAGPHKVRVELLDRPFDKPGLKSRANKPAADPTPYAPRRLALVGLLSVGAPMP